MRVVVEKDYEAAAEFTAEYIARRIKNFAPTKECPFVLGLPTGSTPLGVYEALIRKHKAGQISFANVVTFNMDEYVGLPESHPQSYHYFMMENFFNHIDIKPENINILDGMAVDLDVECERYEKKVLDYGKINLFFGGVGADGHIAFNEPTTSFASRTAHRYLADSTIKMNSRFFDNDVRCVPKSALTVGVGTIMDSQEVVFMATGFAKANAVQHAVEEGVNSMWTISALQNHRYAMLVCDEDATNELKVGTVKYFRNLMRMREGVEFERFE
ncbi:MAG: glucosamine-6-phosphate deaminase [Treponema sp.]|nr:MAG: glucosamine-6-phosphate deaminase [Treponema sp.]